MSSRKRIVANFNVVNRDTVSAAIAEVLAEFKANDKALTRMTMSEIVISNSIRVNPCFLVEICLP
jgi:hypothetical protein